MAERGVKVEEEEERWGEPRDGEEPCEMLSSRLDMATAFVNSQLCVMATYTGSSQPYPSRVIHQAPPPLTKELPAVDSYWERESNSSLRIWPLVRFRALVDGPNTHARMDSTNRT